MGDLIRRKDAIKRIIQETEESGKSVVHINTIKRLLQDVETAYDVDAVAAELKVLRDLSNADQQLAVSQAIGIVKRGGVK